MECSEYVDLSYKWPKTPSNTWAYANCPEWLPLGNENPPKMMKRFCSSQGLWLNKDNVPVINASQSYTDYTNCFPDGLATALSEMTGVEFYTTVSYICANIALVGCIVSLLSLLLAIGLYTFYSCLKSLRTKIHRHLFLAITLECLALTAVIVDDRIRAVNQSEGEHGVNGTLASVVATSPADNTATPLSSLSSQYRQTPVLCNVMICLREYGQTCVYMWMLVEGIHIHNIIVVTVFPTKQGIWPYTVLAWAFPAVLTTIWALTVTFAGDSTSCWQGYHLSAKLWILNSFRLTACLINMGFLLNVLRVLVNRLRASQTTEIQQARTAVKAALVLLPLLGIANCVLVIPSPMNSQWGYIILEFLKAVLPNYQGIFVAFLYCFMSNDVKLCVRRSVARHRMRGGHYDANAQSFILNQRSRSCVTMTVGVRDSQIIASPKLVECHSHTCHLIGSNGKLKPPSTTCMYDDDSN